jgi:protein gp37
MENSKIEWTDHTFNPWIGCTKISEGCKHCYAEALDKRWKRENWGPSATRTRTSDENWKKPLQWNRKAEKEGKRYRVFCASLADVFEQHPDFHFNGSMQTWRDELFHLMRVTPHLDWLVLTKRPENIRQMVPDMWYTYAEGVGYNWPVNVWIGTSIESQEQADKRIPELLNAPAAIRFLSCEPLLGPVEFSDVTKRSDAVKQLGKPALAGIHWVIAGGESGHGARPMHPDWARSLRNQCAAAGVPFLFKQWGEYVPCFMVEDETAFPQQLVEGCIMNKVGKKAAGRLLDSVDHTEYPTPATV